MDHAQHEPALKRRKLTQASRILARPFVTPLKGANRLLQPSDGNAPRGCPTQLAEVSRDETSTEDQPPQSSASIQHDQRSQPPSDDAPSPVVQPSRSRPTSMEITDLARQIRQLEVQIRGVRGDIDTLERAASIRTSHNDERLKQLINKWRNVAQAAADELFPSVERRLAGMGGTAAWRETERVKRSYYSENACGENDNDSPEHDSSPQSSSHPDARAPGTKQYGTKLDTTADATDEANVFTMGMMLQSLNVDFALIRYDVTTQTWLNDVD